MSHPPQARKQIPPHNLKVMNLYVIYKTKTNDAFDGPVDHRM